VTGRCEKIDLETWSKFGLEKKRARMRYKRPLGLRHTFQLTRKFSHRFFHIFLSGGYTHVSGAGELPVTRLTSLHASDLPTLAAVGVTLAAAALLASYLPA
jgi:hypothetical protein